MTETKTPWDLGELIILALDGNITAEQFAVLNERLKKDAEARQYYREFVTTYIALQSSSGAAAAQGARTEPAQPLDPRLWGVLAEDESHAPGVPVEAGKTEPAETPNYTIAGRPSRLPLYTALVAASLLFLVMSYVYVLPLLAPAGSYARLVAASGAKWAGELTAKVGAPVPGESLKLLEGSATIEVRKGALMTLSQGTEVTIQSNKQVYLASGTLSSSITATDGLGFDVKTPTAIVKDLGTEFVVTVEKDGRTTVTVTKGRVELIALTGQTEAQEGQVLAAGQSGQVNPQGDMASSASLSADPLAAFVVKDISGGKGSKKTAEKDGPAKFIDLADIVGGGNGLEANPKLVSVSLVDGAVRDGMVYRPETVSAGGYVRCPAPYIDGVFVPGASRGPCVVSSAGTIFRECPVTSGMFSADVSTSSHAVDEKGVFSSLYLEGRSWSPAASIAMHSNSGITFDLAEIRAANPLIDLTMFSARCGLAFYDGQPAGGGWINIYILVDGQKRFEKSLSATDEAEDVRVRLADKDRFLTLIVTDGADGKLVNDNCLFIKPALHMRAIRK